MATFTPVPAQNLLAVPLAQKANQTALDATNTSLAATQTALNDTNQAVDARLEVNPLDQAAEDFRAALELSAAALSGQPSLDELYRNTTLTSPGRFAVRPANPEAGRIYIVEAGGSWASETGNPADTNLPADDRLALYRRDETWSYRNPRLGMCVIDEGDNQIYQWKFGSTGWVPRAAPEFGVDERQLALNEFTDRMIGNAYAGPTVRRAINGDLIVWGNSGDSTARGAVNSPGFDRGSLVASYLANIGVDRLRMINLGRNSNTAQQWAQTHVINDIANHPTINVYMEGWGVNDLFFGDTPEGALFWEEEGLKRLRAWKNPDDLHVIVLSTVAMEDAPGNRIEETLAQINFGKRRLAQIYDCQFIDLFTPFRFPGRVPSNYDAPLVHPRDQLVALHAQRIVDAIMPSGLAATVRRLNNIQRGFATPTAPFILRPQGPAAQYPHAQRVGNRCNLIGFYTQPSADADEREPIGAFAQFGIIDDPLYRPQKPFFGLAGMFLRAANFRFQPMEITADGAMTLRQNLSLEVRWEFMCGAYINNNGPNPDVQTADFVPQSSGTDGNALRGFALSPTNPLQVQLSEGMVDLSGELVQTGGDLAFGRDTILGEIPSDMPGLAAITADNFTVTAYAIRNSAIEVIPCWLDLNGRIRTLRPVTIGAQRIIVKLDYFQDGDVSQAELEPGYIHNPNNPLRGIRQNGMYGLTGEVIPLNAGPLVNDRQIGTMLNGYTPALPHWGVVIRAIDDSDPQNIESRTAFGFVDTDGAIRTRIDPNQFTVAGTFIPTKLAFRRTVTL